MKKEKILVCLFVLFFLVLTATAENTVNITMQNNKGLCLYNDDVNCQTCDNETLTLSGTQDYLLHLAPMKPLGNCNDYNFSLNNSQMIDKYISYDYAWDFAILGILYAMFLGWTKLRRGAD